MLYEKNESPMAQRRTIVLAEAALMVFAAWLLVGGGIAALNGLLGTRVAEGSLGRRILLLCFVVVTFARMTTMIFVFLKRPIKWSEAVAVPFGFGLYFVGYSVLGGTRTASIDWLDGLAIALFVVGGLINTSAELLRHRWRGDPAHAGTLYTGGLLRYSRHINYFGDFVWVSAWALLTRNVWSIFIPAFLFCMFVFYNAPTLDKHLAERYGTAFDSYRKRTKTFIPFLL